MKIYLICLLLLSSETIGCERQFKLIDDNHVISAKDISLLENIINREARFYPMSCSNNQDISINLKAFISENDFHNYKISSSKTFDIKNGHYLHEEKLLLINLNKRFKETIINLSHHAILKQLMQTPPKWLTFGLGELFEKSYILT